jgi:hypothetical protein
MFDMFFDFRNLMIFNELIIITESTEHIEEKHIKCLDACEKNKKISVSSVGSVVNYLQAFE